MVSTWSITKPTQLLNNFSKCTHCYWISADAVVRGAFWKEYASWSFGFVQWNNFIFPTNVCVLFLHLIVWFSHMSIVFLFAINFIFDHYKRRRTRIPLRQWQRRCAHIFNSFWIGYVNLMLKLRLLLLLFLDLRFFIGIHIFVIWVHFLCFFFFSSVLISFNIDQSMLHIFVLVFFCFGFGFFHRVFMYKRAQFGMLPLTMIQSLLVFSLCVSRYALNAFVM